MSDAIDHLKDVRVCGCGDCKQAVEDALAEFQKLTEEGCVHWYMTRVMIHAIIANLIVQDPRIEGRAERLVARQDELGLTLLSEETLQQVEAIDAANALKAEGGKVN
jgi:hypothetical protein